MGRPIQKKLFGTLTGEKIRAIVNIGEGPEQALIVKQSGTRKYRVLTPVDGPREGVVVLVNKAQNDLLPGEAIVQVETDLGPANVLKLQSKRVSFIEQGVVKSASWVDGSVELVKQTGPIGPVTPDPDPVYSYSVDILGDPGSREFFFYFAIDGAPAGGVVSLEWDVTLDNGVSQNFTGSGLIDAGATGGVLFAVPDGYVVGDIASATYLWEYGGPSGTFTFP